MSIAVPTTGWSATAALTAGARFSYTVTPGAGGSIVMQWSDGTNWFNFTNGLFDRVSTGLVPANAVGIRGQAFATPGSFDTASADPLYPSYLGAVADEAAMVALTDAIIGQYCKRIDTNSNWQLDAQPADTAANWREVGTSTGSTGAGIATSSGSDMTGATAVGGVIESYETSGLGWDINRDGNGVVLSQNPTIYTALKSYFTQISGTNSYYVSSGVRFLSGRLVMTLAEMRAFEAFILGAGGTLAQDMLGFGVFISDVGSYKSSAGVTTVTGGRSYWAGLGFFWEELVYRDDSGPTWSNSASESGDLAPLVIPAKVLGKYGVATSSSLVEFKDSAGSYGAAGTASTKDVLAYVNSTIFGRVGAGAIPAASRWYNARKSVRQFDSTTAQRSIGVTGMWDTSFTASLSSFTAAIDTEATALTIAIRILFAGTSADDNARVTSHAVTVRSIGGLF